MTDPGTGRGNGRIVVVGDLVTDVVARLAEPLAVGSDAAARIRLTGGGQAANTAAWLAYRGVPVTLVATVGDDPAGQDRIAELAAAGVDCAVRRVAGVPTGTLVVIADRGDRTMLADRGAADHLSSSDVDTAFGWVPGVRHLHLSGYTLLGEGSRAAGRRALAAARARGWTTSVDAASAAPLRRVGPATFLDWLQGTGMLFANADEAAVLGLADLADLAGPAGLASPAPPPARPVATVIIKNGAAGARWLGDTAAVATAPSVRVADPTGAGDAFAAGLLAAWLYGADPATALRAGVALGAAAVTVAGARPGRGDQGPRHPS